MLDTPPLAPPPAAAPAPAPRPRVRSHPAKGARRVALVSSVAATLGVAMAMARADGAQVVTTAAIPTTTPSTAGTTGTPAASTGYADGVYLGPAESTRWGDVQVQVTVQGGAVVAVDEVQAPSDRKSAAINSRASAVLESEAIAAQSADIDAVSGATYTSRTYLASLQAALDQATTS